MDTVTLLFSVFLIETGQEVFKNHRIFKDFSFGKKNKNICEFDITYQADSSVKRKDKFSFEI